MLKDKKLLILTSITVLTLLVCIIAFGSLYFSKYNSAMVNANVISSVYSDSKIDFVVPSPSVQQIEEMKKEDHINDIFPCYSVYTSFTISNITISDYVLILDKFEDLEKTMFKDARIKESSGNLTEKSLLVDEVFASQRNLKIGDKVIWKISSTESVELTVDRIYYKNEIDSTKVAVFNMGEQGEIVNRITANNPLKPAVAYIDSSNNEKTDEMLKTYQPLGNKRPREEFNTDAAYEAYLKEFNAENYYEQIVKTDKYKLENSAKAEMYEKNAKQELLLYLIIILLATFVVSLVVDFVFGYARYLISKIKNGISYNKTVMFLILSKICIAAILSVCSLILNSILLNGIFTYSILCVAVIFVGVIVNMIIQIIFVNKVKVKKI